MSSEGSLISCCVCTHQAVRSDALYRARWLSLLSVDDLVRDTVSVLERLGALVSATHEA